MIEAAGHIHDHRVVAGVDVGKGKENPVEAIVPGGMGGKTGGVSRSAVLTIRSFVLKLVLMAVEGITGREAIQVDGANQLATPVALITNLDDDLLEGLELRFVRKDINVGDGCLGLGAVYVHFRGGVTGGITAQRAIGGDAERERGIGGIAIRQLVGPERVQDVRAGGSARDRTRIKAATADPGKERGVLPDIVEDNARVAIVEESETSAEHDVALTGTGAPGKAHARSKIVVVAFVKVLDALHRTVDDALRTKNVVAHQPLGFVVRRKIFPAEAKVEGQIGPDFPVILRKHGIVGGAEVALAVRRTSGGGIHAECFKETARIISKIQKAAELVERTLGAGLIVVVLLTADLRPELPGVFSSNQTEGVGKTVGVLREGARRGRTLRNSQKGAARARIGEPRRPGRGTCDVEVEQFDLWDSEIRTSNRLELVIVVAGEVRTQFVQHGGSKRACPAHGAHVVVRLDANVFDGPIPASELIEPDNIGTDEELIVAASVVDAAVILISVARTRNGEIVDTPIWNSIGAIANPLPRLVAGDVPLP